MIDYSIPVPSLIAYIDPGSGTLILQAIMAAIAGIVLFHKRLYYSIKDYFKKDKQEAGAKSEESGDSKKSQP